MVQTANRKKPKWQLQEAKASFSEVIKATVVQPQTITVHGKETAVILSIEDYKKLKTPRQTLFELFQNSPMYGMELELPPRNPEEMREVSL
jgi:prevent-host-death family protein